MNKFTKVILATLSVSAFAFLAVLTLMSSSQPGVGAPLAQVSTGDAIDGAPVERLQRDQSASAGRLSYYAPNEPACSVVSWYLCDPGSVEDKKHVGNKYTWNCVVYPERDEPPVSTSCEWVSGESCRKYGESCEQYGMPCCGTNTCESGTCVNDSDSDTYAVLQVNGAGEGDGVIKNIDEPKDSKIFCEHGNVSIVGGQKHLCRIENGGIKKITLKAYPVNGSVFSKWEGACFGTGDSCTLSVNKGDSRTVTARFKKAMVHYIDVSSEPSGAKVYFMSGSNNNKGEYKGVTPIKFKVPVGDGKLVVELENYKKYEKHIRVESDVYLNFLKAFLEKSTEDSKTKALHVSTLIKTNGGALADTGTKKEFDLVLGYNDGTSKTTPYINTDINYYIKSGQVKAIDTDGFLGYWGCEEGENVSDGLSQTCSFSLTENDTAENPKEISLLYKEKSAPLKKPTCSLIAESNPVKPGETVELHWEATDATSVFIKATEGGAYERVTGIDGKGTEYYASLAENTTYYLLAENLEYEGSNGCNRSVTVRLEDTTPACEVPSFSGSNNKVTGVKGKELTPQSLPTKTRDQEVTYSIDGELPNGLSYNARTHKIVGIPTEAGTSTVTLKLVPACDTTKSATIPITITITDPAEKPKCVLTMSKSANKTTNVHSGDTVEYNITVSNAGKAPCDKVVVTDTISDGGHFDLNTLKVRNNTGAPSNYYEYAVNGRTITFIRKDGLGYDSYEEDGRIGAITSMTINYSLQVKDDDKYKISNTAKVEAGSVTASTEPVVVNVSKKGGSCEGVIKNVNSKKYKGEVGDSAPSWDFPSEYTYEIKGSLPKGISFSGKKLEGKYTEAGKSEVTLVAKKSDCNKNVLLTFEVNKPGTCSLSVEKSVDKKTAKKGNDVTYTITVKNESKKAVCKDVVLKDSFDSDLDIDVKNISESENGFKIESTTGGGNKQLKVEWTKDSLDPEEEATVTVVGTIGRKSSRGYNINNIAYASSSSNNASAESHDIQLHVKGEKKDTGGGGGTVYRRTHHGRSGRVKLVITAPKQPTASMSQTALYGNESAGLPPAPIGAQPTYVTLDELPYTGPADIAFFLLFGLTWGTTITYFLAGRRTKLKMRNALRGMFKKKLVVSNKM